MPTIKEKMANALSLPREIALDLPMVSAMGQEEVTIENYKHLLEFTDKKIRVRTKVGVMVIEGEGLTLRQVTAEHLLVAGRLAGILFHE